MAHVMLPQSEVLTLLFGTVLLVFAVANRAGLRRMPGFAVLAGGLAAWLAAWTLTILEGLFLPVVLNLLEHLCYAAGSALLCLWCWQAFVSQVQRDHAVDRHS
ncbi:MAG: hypothetical protein ACYS8K_03540 [Planctomycetota bacterium]|jgi:hypothetical protein